MSIRENIISKAKEYLGYKEGNNNDTIFGNWYGLPHNPWCAMFVSYIMNEIGVSTDIVPKFASCTVGTNWFKDRGKFKDNKYTPQVGDIIFIIWDIGNSTPDHVGIVEKVEGNTVYTIEGNRGDCVCEKSYGIGSAYIFGYGIPDYENGQATVENKTENEVEQQITYSLIKKGSKGNLVRIAQEKLIQKGYSLLKYGADGDFGSETEKAIRELQKDSKVAVDGIIGKDTWNVLNSNFVKPKSTYPNYLIKQGQRSEDVRKVQAKLIELGYSCGSYGADSIFGIATYNAVKAFQQANGLGVDGIVGVLTWNKLFN